MTATAQLNFPTIDFADYNPGHGTNTVREEAAWITENYGLKVRTQRAGDQVQFTVSGRKDAVAELQKLTGQA